jgi:hypothetical protein
VVLFNLCMTSLSNSSHNSNVSSSQEVPTQSMLPPLMYVPTYTLQPALPEELRELALLKEPSASAHCLPAMEPVFSSGFQPGAPLALPQLGLPQLGLPQLALPQLGLPQLGLPQLGDSHSEALQPGVPQLPGLEQIASQQFRDDADFLDRSACCAFESATPAALALMPSLPAGTPISEAYRQVMPNYEEQKWASVPLERYDSVLGTVISTVPNGIMRIVTHSNIVDSVFFDTIATGQMRQIATYRTRYCSTMEHSGDVKVELPDGRTRLDHTVTLKRGYSQGAVIVSPWKQNAPMVVSALEPTLGISEIQIMDSNRENRKRFIIPLAYRDCGANTACIAVKLAYNPETNVTSATLCRDYIMGFADNTELLLNEVERVYPA